jgi:catechol 2,3-dioxygenase-like lactoylglutathione lyase family enzyme
MLTNQPITTILPVVDLDRAKKFYVDKLGLRAAENLPTGGLVLEAGAGSRVELSQRDKPTKADHTALTFEVDDVEEEVNDLEKRGVRFEDYDFPNLKTQKHIASVAGMKCAWFKDPEGNILCIHQKH